MKKSERFEFLIPFIILIVVIFGYGVLAAYVETSDGGNSFNFNESVVGTYNISINNTGVGAESNITEVNMTLPSSLEYITGSESSDTNNSVFSNTSNILSWKNDSGLITNLTRNYFVFNATASAPGTYNISVVTTNSSGSTETNLSVTINDTLPPRITFSEPSTDQNLSQDYIIVNVSANDTGILSDIVVRLYNSTRDEINSSIVNSSPLYVNFTNLSEGVYYVNASANDTINNLNNSDTMKIILDTTNPSISLSGTSTETTLNISITITDTLTGSGGKCTTDRSGATVSGSGTSQSIYESGLSCDESYTYNVSCSDGAGNENSKTGSFTTDSCSSSSSSDSSEGGGSNSTNSFWKSTYVANSDKFRIGYNKELGEKYRVSLKIDGETHYVGIISITSSKVTVNVSSNPQQAIMSVGESKKFDADENGYYDIKVTINSINTTTDKANITILSINEKIITSVGNVISTPVSTTDKDKPKVIDTNTGKEITATKVPSFIKNKWFALGIVLFIFMIGGAIYFVMEKDEARKRIKISGHSKNIRVH